MVMIRQHCNGDHQRSSYLKRKIVRCSDDSGKLILTEVKDGPLLQVMIVIMISMMIMIMIM